MLHHSILIWDIIKQLNRTIKLRKPLHKTLLKEYNYRIDLIHRDLGSTDVLPFKAPLGAKLIEINKKAQTAYLYLKQNNL